MPWQNRFLLIYLLVIEALKERLRLLLLRVCFDAHSSRVGRQKV